MIAEIFSTLTEIANGFISFLVNLFEKVVTIFWAAPSGSDTTGSLTLMGTLLLISVATGLVIWGLYFIKGLVTRIRNK